MIVCVCKRLRDETGLETVALSGGVFMNAILLGSSIVWVLASVLAIWLPLMHVLESIGGRR